MRKIYIVVLFFALAILQNVRAQNISNEGTDFWTVFPTHDPNQSSLATMNVNITSKFNSEVTVSCGSYFETKSIPANTVVTFLVDRVQSYIDYASVNRVLTNRGIHIVVTPGMPKVVAYSHVFAGNRSAATLILPVDALGQKYFSMNYTQDVGGKNYMILIAAEDNTELILNKNDNTKISILLAKKGDVYEYMPTGTEDLTGTFVETATGSICKRFAAFSGSTSIFIGCTLGRDPLLQQLYSTNSWGKMYGVVPFINRRYIIRVLAQEDNTSVIFDGGNPIILNRGKFIERTLTAATIVSADKLISVAEYSYSQNCSSVNGTTLTGDPEMVILNPVEFNIKNITVFSSDKNLILERYVNVFMKTSKTSTFKINGAVPNAAWVPIPSNPTYSGLQVQVFVPSLTLTADDGFNAIAYGFGNTESYAYSAGTNLASTQFLLVVNKASNQENSAACVGQPADFKLTLPYSLDKITWKFDDGTPDFVESPAVGFPNQVNGQTLYVYTTPVNKVFNTVGQVQVKAVGIISPSSGSCSGSEIEFDFNINVEPLPTPIITLAETGCSDKEISFSSSTSTANVSGKTLTKWLWDFGDGSPQDNSQNPKHTYSVINATTFKVTLSVGADNGCFSDVVTSNILVGPQPVAIFNSTFNGITSANNNINSCVNTTIAFEDKSTIGNGAKIIEWLWDFGDKTNSTLQSPVHSYTSAGTYTVSLIVKSDTGCESLPLTKTFNITDLPINDFVLPEVCAKDGIAIFKNLSTDYDKQITGLTSYLWDFGEPASGVLNTSNAVDGNHKYSFPGAYKVILTIKNTNGCLVVLQKDFTVNDSSPKANFEVVNTNFCSNKALVLKNTSIVDIGTISRLEWYMDGVKVLSDDDPLLDKLYTFVLPSFGGNTDKIYDFRLVVFSGATCTNQINKTITIKPSPQITFTPLTPVCENDGTVKLIEGQESSLQNGIGVYSGKAMAADGTFNPKLAGPGIHTITYTFTGLNGCDSTLKQDMMVFESPLANAGPSVTILSGGQYKIPATASGKNVSYKWTPSLGLDRDDVLSPIAAPEENTEYTLTVTTDEGCTVQTKILIKVLGEVHPPTSFSPNADGINDVWNIPLLDTYPDNTVEIFNRAGQKVFESKGYKIPFDGNFQNKPLPVGVYYYIIAPKSGRNTVTGALTLIR